MNINETNMINFCKRFHSATYFPIHYYENTEKLCLSLPKYDTNLEFVSCFLPRLTKSDKNPDYYISKSFGYYGIIRNQDRKDFIVIGPIFSTPLHANAIRDFMHECAIPLNLQSNVIQYLQSLPIVSFHQFLNILIFVHFELNQENLDIFTHFSIKDTTNKKIISTKHTNQLYNLKEHQTFHNTYQFEQRYLGYIKNGEPNKLKELTLQYAETQAIQEGNLAEDALRQRKNIFISAATLACRSAVAGGLDIEQAYQLSDIYIQECERLQSIDAILNLSYTLNVDYAERVSKNKMPQGMSSEIFQCVQFISTHTNEQISVNDVANFIGKSRSYTSKKFKESLGFNLSSFIMSCKLEEAKSLLAYTNKPLSDISNYLCFSSQAYFQNVFKKKYNLTPLQYRNQVIN